MRNEEHGGARDRAQLLDERDDVALDCHVEAARRLVCEDEGGVAGKSEGDHHPLAHAAGQFVRVLVQHALAKPHPADRRSSALAGLVTPDILMSCDSLGDLPANLQGRVDRHAGILEHHGDLAAAKRPHIALALREKVLTAERDPPGDAGSPRQQSDDG